MKLENLVNISPYLFIFILSGGILSVSLMNFFELNTEYITLLFLVFGSTSVLLAKKINIEFPKLNRIESFLCIFLALLFSFPRLPYLIETLLNNSFNAACWDDWWHIQEFASLIYSREYPPRSTFDQSNFLSFYYAPWVFGAAIFKIGIFDTIKQIMFISHLLYSLIFSYAALAAGKILYQSSKGFQWTLFFMIVFFGGFDFFFGFASLLYKIYKSSFDGVIPHAEWWMSYFGFKIQLSNFFTLVLWVPHHLSSALAILLGLFIINRGTNAFSILLSGICFAFSFFSSVFVFIGAIPLFILYFIRVKNSRFPLIISFIVSVLVSSPLIWMYLRKDSANGFIFFGALNNFWKDNKILAFFLFLCLLAIDFFPIIFAGFLKKNVRDIQLLFISTLYLILTFFISYSGANNFAMRGSIIPIFSIYYVMAPQLYKFFSEKNRFFIVLFLPFFMGSIWEFASFSTNALKNYQNNTEFNKIAYKSNSEHGVPPNDLVMSESENFEYGWYLLENMKKNNKENLTPQDLEIMNKDNDFRLSFKKILKLFSH